MAIDTAIKELTALSSENHCHTLMAFSCRGTDCTTVSFGSFLGAGGLIGQAVTVRKG
jgi:hypothetical protein